MKKNVARRWVNALRSGKYKKTTGFLKQKDENENESYCVLGVLCDLYKKDGKPLSEKEDGFEEAIAFAGETQIPPKKVLRWAGLGELEAEVIADLNDDNKSFKQIANYIENNQEIL